MPRRVPYVGHLTLPNPEDLPLKITIANILLRLPDAPKINRNLNPKCLP